MKMSLIAQLARREALQDAADLAHSYVQSPEIVRAILALRDGSPEMEARIIECRKDIAEGKALVKKLMSKKPKWVEEQTDL